MILRHPVPTVALQRAITDLACAPSLMPERLDPSLRRSLAHRLCVSGPARTAGSARLDSWTILSGLREHPASRETFSWSPRTARRILGTAAASLVIRGAEPNPTSAVRHEIARHIELSQGRARRPSSLSIWLSEAPRGVLGAVMAEAVSYATDLVSLFDWNRVGTSGHVGIPDPVWVVPGAPWISLRGRRDAVVDLDPVHRTRALISVRAGRPRPSSPHDLAIVALIDALAAPDAPLATRVVGIWPSAGRALSLEVSPEIIDDAARLVLRAVTRPAAVEPMASAAG